MARKNGFLAIFDLIRTLAGRWDETSVLAKFVLSSSVATVCLVAETVTNPDRAINTFLIHVIDVVSQVFPSTPEQYKLATMASSFYSSLPPGLDVVAHESLTGVAGILGIVLLVKAIKMLPFV